MRFEVAAAWAMGIGLPLLEALRRKTNFVVVVKGILYAITIAALVCSLRRAPFRDQGGRA